MTTLSIRKTGSRAKKLMTLGGDAGAWEVSDGEKVLATARGRGARWQLQIDADGQRLTARMKWKLDVPDEVEVVDGATGQPVIHGKRRSGKRMEQDWTFTLSDGRTVSWAIHGGEEKVGFLDPDGGPIMRMGHDPSFDTSAPGGTLRVLLRFWGATIASTDRFLVFVEDGAVGRAVAAEDVPILALLGMWLEKAAEAPESTTGGFA